MKELLKNNVVKVVFIKKNGDRREMLCTLKTDIIPKVSGTSKERTDDLMVVYDIEAEGWRSFYESSVISFEKSEETK